MQYSWVIFDLDGTLTASEEGIIRSAQFALQEMGFPLLSDSQMQQFIGPPLKYSFMTYAGMSAAQAEEAIAHYRRRYSTIGWAENRVYEGIPALCKALRRQGVHLGVATGKPQVFAEKILDHFSLSPFFDAICGKSEDDHSSDKAHLLMRVMGDQPGPACMVGDRKFDIEPARALGMDAIGVLYGAGPEEELRNAGATHIAKTVDELAQILLGDAPRESGMFISLEGSDGCGKTTQKKLLAEWLKTCGWHVKETREPGGGAISEAIRGLVLDPAWQGMTDICEAYLFAASRAQHVRDTIRPALACGQVVLCDRFVDSSIAFQGAGRGLGTRAIRELNQLAVDGTMPDITLFLDIDPHKAMVRRLDATAPDRIEQEKSDFVDRVYQAFCDIARSESDRVISLSAEGSVEEIQACIRQEVLSRLVAIK